MATGMATTARPTSVAAISGGRLARKPRSGLSAVVQCTNTVAASR